MLNSDEQKGFIKMFEETFGYLLNEFVDSQKEILEKENVDSSRNEKLMRSELKNITPSSSTEKQHSSHFEQKQLLSSLNSEQEARVIAIALQEIRKMKEFTIVSYNHQTAEFNRVYASYPLLFAKKFEQVYLEAHLKIESMTADAEHFICGNFHNIEAVKNNLKLVQLLKEKRLSILRNILAFYDKRK